MCEENSKANAIDKAFEVGFSCGNRSGYSEAIKDLYLAAAESNDLDTVRMFGTAASRLIAIRCEKESNGTSP
jgi:hypothetical protein